MADERFPLALALAELQAPFDQALAAAREIGARYLFVNAMTTVSAVIFLYSPDTTLAAIAVLNMDDAGDVAPAAAMGMMIFYTNVVARLIHLFLSRNLLLKSQAWRLR